MLTVRETPRLRGLVAEWREAGERVALVPTMGNLHRGHISLVELARQHAERVVVCIFVNPSQFGPSEDFATYPRTLERDRARLRRAGADALFAPEEADVYPFGVAAMTRVSVPGLSTILCGASRPGHFDGVTSVVCRLLNMAQPDVAVFGQKDYQQLLIIQRMVRDLHLPVAIVTAPTWREEDGLATSSRNQYLGAEERARAPALHAALAACAQALTDGQRDFAALEATGRAALAAAGMQPDYFAVRSAADLAEPRAGERRLVVLAAAHCGRARLIDNLLVDLPAPKR